MRSFALAAGLLALSTGACGRMPVEGEVETPGAAARIVRQSYSGEGGLDLVVTIDSASARWTRSCRATVAQVPCPAGWVATGPVAGTQLDRLFRTVRSSEFRALRAEYDLSATWVDAPLYTLTVVADGRSRQVRWALPGRVPDVLLRFDDQVLMTTGLYTPDR